MIFRDKPIIILFAFLISSCVIKSDFTGKGHLKLNRIVTKNNDESRLSIEDSLLYDLSSIDSNSSILIHLKHRIYSLNNAQFDTSSGVIIGDLRKKKDTTFGNSYYSLRATEYEFLSRKQVYLKKENLKTDTSFGIEDLGKTLIIEEPLTDEEKQQESLMDLFFMCLPRLS